TSMGPGTMAMRDPGLVRGWPQAAALRALLRLADRPPRRPPALQTIHHDADVRVAGFDRPTGSPVRRPSMRVGAVKDEPGVLARRQLLFDVVRLVARQEGGARDDSFLRPEVGAVCVEQRDRSFVRAE